MHWSLPKQRSPHVENRRLLDLARRVDNCVNCHRYVPGGCSPAHSNLQRDGRGEGYKSHDHHHGALCPECHDWYDRGTKGPDPTGLWQPTKAEKAQFIGVMKDRTMDLYFANGWIVVAT
jgi:hypothetical protein